MTKYLALHSRQTLRGEHEHEWTTEGPSWAVLVTGGIFLIVLIHATLAILGTIQSLDGEFFGFDTYNRMSRVQALWEHGRWFDSFDPGISPPAGFQSHWSRPLDGLIVALAFPLHFFMPDDRALFWAGSFVSPLFHAISFIAMLIILRPVFQRAWLENLPLVFALCHPFVSSFYLGRPDHHGLELSANLLIVVLLARALLITPTVRLAIALGFTASFAAWAEISGFLMAIAVLAGLGSLWCLFGRRYVIFGLAVHASMLVGLLSFTFLERGPNPDVLLAIEGDRLSLMHPMLTALPFVFWLGGVLLAKRDLDTALRYRLVWATLSGILVAAGTLLLVPSFQYSDILGVDPYYFANRSTSISEYQPILNALTEDKMSLHEAIGQTFRYTWVYILGLVALLFLIIRDRGNKRALWLLLLLVWAISVVYYANQFFGFQYRHMAYFSAVVLIPLLEAMHRLLERWSEQERIQILKRVALRGAVVTLPIAANVLMALSITQATASNESGNLPHSLANANSTEETLLCNVGKAKERLSQISDAEGGEPLFLALPELSGKLRYHLRANIFAIGQHRYQAGFKPMLQHFRSSDMEYVETWLRETGVDAVVLCNIGDRKRGYFREIEHGDYFYRRLQLDDPPAFLKPYDTGYAGLKAYVLREPGA